jgi:hypothetical protein
MRPEATIPPCYGKSALFDSRRPVDHREAKKLCAACPLIQACRANLKATQAAAVQNGGPEGTWAGKLYGRPINHRGEAQMAPNGIAERAARNATGVA